MNITNLLAIKATKLIVQNKSRNELEIKKVKIGIEIFINNLYKVICIIVLSVLFNILPEMIIILTAFSILRRYAFGLHANSSLLCTVMTFAIFYIGIFVSKSFFINDMLVIFSYLFIIIMIYRYAPSDTLKHPILIKKSRKELRNKSISICFICLLISCIITDHIVKQLILIGIIFEVVSIIPITYKLMNRSYKNYEKYNEQIN